MESGKNNLADKKVIEVKEGRGCYKKEDEEKIIELYYAGMNNYKAY